MTQKSSRKTRAATRRPPGGEARLARTPDSGVVLSVLLLASIGTVMSYSATATLALDHSLPPLFLAHIGALGIGLVLTTVITWTPIDRWRQAALPLWLISLGMLSFKLEPNDAHRLLFLFVYSISIMLAHAIL